MNKNEALKLFENYAEKKYGKIRVLSETEKKKRFLFEFCEKDDLFPVDYPIVSVEKSNRKIEELSFLDAEHRDIIYGD